MLITEIAAQHPQWSRITCAETWLKNFARETGTADVESEFGFVADDNGEYTISAEDAERVWSHDWPNGL